MAKKECYIKRYKNQAVHVAKDLHYGDDVIDRIKVAQTEGEVDRIMKTARHALYD